MRGISISVIFPLGMQETGDMYWPRNVGLEAIFFPLQKVIQIWSAWFKTGLKIKIKKKGKKKIKSSKKKNGEKKGNNKN